MGGGGEGGKVTQEGMGGGGARGYEYSCWFASELFFFILVLDCYQNQAELQS